MASWWGPVSGLAEVLRHDRSFVCGLVGDAGTGYVAVGHIGDRQKYSVQRVNFAAAVEPVLVVTLGFRTWRSMPPGHQHAAITHGL
jgi:hypothetical protein